MSFDYDVWKCTPPEDPDEALAESDAAGELVVQYQNEDIASSGWDLLDDEDRRAAIKWLEDHQPQYLERAVRTLRQRAEERRAEGMAEARGLL